MQFIAGPLRRLRENAVMSDQDLASVQISDLVAAAQCVSTFFFAVYGISGPEIGISDLAESREPVALGFL